MDSFYVVLPSNTPYPENKTSDYLVKLPNIIDLSDGNWTVALSSIVYPQSFSSTEEKQIIKIHYDNNSIDEITIPKDIKIKSIKHLEKIVNESFSKKRSPRNVEQREVELREVESHEVQKPEIIEDQVYTKIVDLQYECSDIKKQVLQTDEEVPHEAELIRIKILDDYELVVNLYNQAKNILNKIKKLDV